MSLTNLFVSAHSPSNPKEYAMNINDYLTLLNQLPTDELMKLSSDITSQLSVMAVDTLPVKGSWLSWESWDVPAQTR